MVYQPKGYPKVASLMSKEKDVAVFRRFDDLNFLNLLALQAEIIDLEKDLRRECRLDDMASDSSQQQQSEPVYNSENFKLSRESGSAQYQKLKTLRERLMEYNELAIQISRLNTLDDPIPSQLDTLQDWLRDRNGRPFLTGYEAETWAENKPGLYMCLRPHVAEDSDLFTRYISNVLLGLYHRFLGQDLGTARLLTQQQGTLLTVVLVLASLLVLSPLS
ncbi:MAG: hypothetical protein Q9190_005241 [Brigantiaea leucoxantha]